MELISIIVPVYNVEKYLTKCVNSITGQTYRNLEIILVDDGSRDRSGQMCDELAAEDSRIRVVHKENGGLSDARNAGIDVAAGEYLMFVDSDDYIKSNMVERLYDRIVRDDSDMCIGNVVKVDEDGRELEVCGQFDTESTIWSPQSFWENYYSYNLIYCVVAWNKLYKRSIFHELRYACGKLHEDEFILHHVISQCRRISCISEPLYYYLQRGNSIMSAGYNVRRLDVIEAFLARTKDMYNDGNFWGAQKTMGHSISYFLEAYRQLDFHVSENKVRYRELKKSYGKLFRIVKKNASMRFKLNILSFLIGEKCYIAIHKYVK